jgi:hypothetical protein
MQRMNATLYVPASLAMTHIDELMGLAAGESSTGQTAVKHQSIAVKHQSN